MSKMDELVSGLRRVVTCNDKAGRSRIMIDGGPAAEFRSGDLGGLHEIWTDAAHGPLDPGECADQGAGQPVLSPPKGGVKIRWFTAGVAPPGAPPELMAELTKKAFQAMGAGDHQPDTSRHPAMHTTPTIDAIILV